jgi:hypothetical protein
MSSLILHGIREPAPFASGEDDAVFPRAEFNNIAASGHAEDRRLYPESANCEYAAALFREIFVVGAFVQDISLDRIQVIGPLLLEMYECPLPAAEGEVLYAGELQILVLGIGHPIVVTVTPEGMAEPSIFTS